MSLEDIEQALRPNFIWIKHNDKRLQTDPLITGNQSAGQIVFIGVALKNGFKRKEIIDYLAIETIDEYNRKKALCKLGRKVRNSMIDIKFRLTQNNLMHNMNQKDKPFVSWVNFNY